MNIERTTDVGKLIEIYRNCIQDALDASRQLENQSIERPWITIKCKRAECCNDIVLRTVNGLEVPEHTHRIRLEIR
jgi:hypothetical protein